MEAKQAVLLYAERETWVYDLGNGLWGEDLGGACPRELLERMQSARIDWAWDRENLIQCVMRQMYQLIILIFDPEKSLTVEKWEEIQKLRKFSNSKPTHIWLLAARSPASSVARREMWIQKLWEWESATPKDIGIALRRFTEKVFLYLPDVDGNPRRFEEKRIVSIEAIQGRHCIYYMDTDKKIVERVLLAYRINLIQKALEEICMAYTYLEFFQTGLQKRFYNQCQQLRICFCTAVTDKLCTNLSGLFQTSLKIGTVDEGICHITKTNRHVFRCKILCNRSGDRRRYIRPKNQRISFSVKEFIKFPGRNGSNLPAEYIKIFKGRCLNVFITISGQYLVKSFLYILFASAFSIIDVSYALRRVQDLFVHRRAPCLLYYSRVLIH